jgi:hypothetical protein
VRCLWEPSNQVDVVTVKSLYFGYACPNVMTQVLSMTHRRRALWECRACRRFYCSTVCYAAMSVTRSQWLCRICEVSTVYQDSVFQMSHTIFWGKDAKQALFALLVIDYHYRRKRKPHLSTAFLLHYMPRHLVRDSTPVIPLVPLPVPPPLLLPELEHVRQSLRKAEEDYDWSAQEGIEFKVNPYQKYGDISIL